MSSTTVRRVAGLRAPEHGLDALHQQPLRKRFADEIVGAHLEAEQLVDLLVLRGEEDDRQLAPLAQAPQELHAVHARHLDVEDGEIGRALGESVERACAVVVGLGLVALRLQHHAQGGENVTVVIDKCDRWHCAGPLRRLAWLRCRGLGLRSIMAALGRCSPPVSFAGATNIIVAQVNMSVEIPDRAEIAPSARGLMRRAFKGSLATIDRTRRLSLRLAHHACGRMFPALPLSSFPRSRATPQISPPTPALPF